MERPGSRAEGEHAVLNYAYFWILIGSSLAAVLLGAHGWYNRKVRGAAAFAAMMMAGAVWSGSEAMVVAFPSIGEKMLWMKLGSMGCIASSLAWLVLALQFTGRGRWLTPRHIAAVSAVPAVGSVLIWTNDLHHLVWESVKLNQAQTFSYVTWDITPAAAVLTIYLYSVLSVSAFLLMQSIRRAGPPYRTQAAILLLGLLFPVTGSLLSSLGPESLRMYQLGPSLICLSGITVGWGLLRYYLFDIVPVARDTVVESMQDGVVVIDLHGRVVDCNASARQVLGLSQPATAGRPAAEVFAPWPALQELLPKLAPMHTELTSLVDGAEMRYEANISRLCIRNDQPVGLLVTLHDITERKRIEEDLLYTSFHDPLTGLYNRAYFEEEMHRLESSRSYPITIVGIDVDGLKLINDTMGHRTGDDLLRDFAGVLCSSLRSSDVVARVGGDEFALILPVTSEETAKAICERLEHETSKHNTENPSLPLSFSWGTHTSTGPDMPLEQAFRLADLNMYREKMCGKVEARRQIVDCLIAALNRKAPSIEGHAQRVWGLAVRMGEAARLSDKEIEALELLARVHDIGMVGVTEEILLKAEPLTRPEREEIARHPLIGQKIAQSAPHLEHIADLILHHHEWWNGNGYPGSLLGEEIPLLCRILAVANTYDSLVTGEPNSRALSREEAINQIGAGAGTQFDPALVALFVGVMSAERDPYPMTAATSGSW